jgi:hypothetical protein
LQQGDGVVIVDAGGGTIDISSYSGKTSASIMTFEEVAAPQCSLSIFPMLCNSKTDPALGHFHGSVFVNIQARLFLGSPYFSHT